MEIKLIDGVFTTDEAESLLTTIFKTKIAFHEQKIKTIQVMEEDIEHSERRIIQLQETLREAIREMREKGETHTSLNAYIEVSSMERITA